MTRKHYQAMAYAIQATRQAQHDAGGDPVTIDATLDRMADELAIMCSRENARFDVDRFLTACGVKVRYR